MAREKCKFCKSSLLCALVYDSDCNSFNCKFDRLKCCDCKLTICVENIKHPCFIYTLRDTTPKQENFDDIEYSVET